MSTAKPFENVWQFVIGDAPVGTGGGAVTFAHTYPRMFYIATTPCNGLLGRCCELTPCVAAAAVCKTGWSYDSNDQCFVPAIDASCAPSWNGKLGDVGANSLMSTVELCKLEANAGGCVTTSHASPVALFLLLLSYDPTGMPCKDPMTLESIFAWGSGNWPALPTTILGFPGGVHRHVNASIQRFLLVFLELLLF